MLLTRQKKTFKAPMLNMAAMIDVVFLLLIFFMCTSSFQAPEHKFAALLPQTARSGKPLSDFEPILIQVEGSSEVPVITCDRLPCTNLEDLRQELRRRYAVADIPIIVQGAELVPFDLMVEVMDLCYQTGFTQVAYSVEQMG